VETNDTTEFINRNNVTAVSQAVAFSSALNTAYSGTFSNKPPPKNRFTFELSAVAMLVH